MEIPIFRPTIRRKHMNSVLSCLVSDRIGSGSLSRECAAAFSRHLGGAGAVCLASFSQAIQMALDTLKLERGTAVLVSALAPAYYHTILVGRGLVPLVADVDPLSGLMPPTTVENHRSREPGAVIVTHPLGFLTAAELFQGHDLPVIEDISEALGGSEGNARSGSSASLCLLSLGVEGIVTAGGGGILTTGDKRLFNALKANPACHQRQAQLADMNAALGLSQLKDIDRFLAYRREIAAHFSKALASASRHRTLIQPDEQENVPFSFPVRVADSMKLVRQYAAKKNIMTRPAFSDRIIAMEELQAGAGREDITTTCPNAADLWRRCLLFPLYPTLGKKNIQLIAKVLSTLP
jgi:perosamine synthetase